MTRGIVKLVQCLNKSLSRNGDCREMNAVSSSDIKIIWMNKIVFITKRVLVLEITLSHRTVNELELYLLNITSV
jgi:hypothetical protein